jgi:hypothetical protein
VARRGGGERCAGDEGDGSGFLNLERSSLLSGDLAWRGDGVGMEPLELLSPKGSMVEKRNGLGEFSSVGRYAAVQ